MAGMKFGYKEFPVPPTDAFPNTKKIFRPIIPVTIEYDGKKIGYEALLASGPD